VNGDNNLKGLAVLLNLQNRLFVFGTKTMLNSIIEANQIIENVYEMNHWTTVQKLYGGSNKDFFL
jgi:hypothetical protein